MRHHDGRALLASALLVLSSSACTVERPGTVDYGSSSHAASTPAAQASPVTASTAMDEPAMDEPSASTAPTAPKAPKAQSEATSEQQAAAPAAGPADDGRPYYATWYTALDDVNSPILGFSLPATGPLAQVTVRQVAHVSIGGDMVRLRLSNRFGTVPITFDRVRLAQHDQGPTIVAETDTKVTFRNLESITLAPGEDVWSDDVAFPIGCHDDMTASLFVSGTADIATEHRYAQRTNYVALGDLTSEIDMGWFPSEISSSYWLTEIDVKRAEPTDVLIAFGDSISDGVGSTAGANLRYPDQLSNALPDCTADGVSLGLANAGIGGNRWLHGGLGPAGVERFMQDALSISGGTHLIILLGINDIGFGVFSEAEAVTAEQLQTAMDDAVSQAHEAGLKVLLGTLLPFGESLYYTAQGEAVRDEVNAWIRAYQKADGVIDFDRLIRDADEPVMFDERYDSGDHLHPNDAGYAEMAQAAYEALQAVR